MGFMVDSSGNVVDVGAGSGYQSPDYAQAMAALQQDYATAVPVTHIGVQDDAYAQALEAMQASYAAAYDQPAPPPVRVAPPIVVTAPPVVVPVAAPPVVVPGPPGMFVPVSVPPPVFTPPPPVVVPVVAAPPVVVVPAPPVSITSTPPGGMVLPTPQVTAGQFPRTVTLAVTPPEPAALDSTPPALPVMVRVSGRQRTVMTAAEIVDALTAGGTIVRADGSAAIIQQVFAPGWGGGSGWLIDGNPINVIQGQGWYAEQLPLVQQLAAAGTIPQPTLLTQPTIQSPWYRSPLVWAGGAAALWYFWPRRRAA